MYVSMRITFHINPCFKPFLISVLPYFTLIQFQKFTLVTSSYVDDEEDGEVLQNSRFLASGSIFGKTFAKLNFLQYRLHFLVEVHNFVSVLDP